MTSMDWMEGRYTAVTIQVNLGVKLSLLHRMRMSTTEVEEPKKDSDLSKQMPTYMVSGVN